MKPPPTRAASTVSWENNRTERPRKRPIYRTKTHFGPPGAFVMGKLTDNRFLFGFEGRINRARYWYALFASGAFCIVFMAIAATIIGVIFGATVKSVHVNFLGAFGSPFSLPFSASFVNAD